MFKGNKMKCKGKYNNGEECIRDAMLAGYCIMHYNKYVLKQTKGDKSWKNSDHF